MAVYSITVAFCPASQLAVSLMRANVCPDFTYIVQGHYPINRLKNNRDIEMVCKAFKVNYLDPGKDLGSAQSQNWALEQIQPEDDDLWLNLDPDSHCSNGFWVFNAKKYLQENLNCVAVHCWSKMWEPFRNRLQIENGIGMAIHPTPFNLSMFRCSFIKQIGGLRQMGEKWGELEAMFHQSCKQYEKYHAYLMDFVEDESGKYMQDRQLLEYKDAYMRTASPNDFRGSYEEFLRLKYPHLLEMDTLIPSGTEFR